MVTLKLEKAEWRPFFARMAKALVGKRAEIEIASLTLGHQIEAEWLPLLGITYEPKTDTLDIALDGLDHLIEHPHEIYVDASGMELRNIEIIDCEGVAQIVRLRDALMLP